MGCRWWKKDYPACRGDESMKRTLLYKTIARHPAKSSFGLWLFNRKGKQYNFEILSVCPVTSTVTEIKSHPLSMLFV